jgi:TetR/AcrR family acrAB operon transcriptional repressor
MARKAKVDAEKTRARILASALTLFVRKGYENTTFNDIAAKLKMTKGAVYWHFESKADLLAALLGEAMSRFSAALSERMEGREPTFPVIAEMLLESAGRIVSDKSHSEFFMLMQTGLKWTDVKLAEVARKLIAGRACGPYQAVVSAVEADIAAGRVRDGVNAYEVASQTMALWDGLIQRKIEGFLMTDMSVTLEKAFAALWESIKVGKDRKES